MYPSDSRPSGLIGPGPMFETKNAPVAGSQGALSGFSKPPTVPPVWAVAGNAGVARPISNTNMNMRRTDTLPSPRSLAPAPSSESHTPDVNRHTPSVRSGSWK